MTQDPNRAEEQAQRDRVPGFDVVLEAVVVHLPALQTLNADVNEFSRVPRWHMVQRRAYLPCREEVDGEEVDPSRGDSHLAREHPHDTRQLRYS